MSVTATTMKCPTCSGQTLESLSAPIGTMERCPSCGGLFISLEVVVAASPEPAACQSALDETKELLLPTDRWCPKCAQKLFDGRVRSRGVIFTLCPVCQSLWVFLPALRQFEEPVEKTLRRQIDIATSSGVQESSANSFSGSAYAPFPEADSGFAGVFRGLATLFNRLADRTASPSDQAPKKKPAPVKPPPKKPEIKPPLVKAEPPKVQTPVPETILESEAPKIEIPEFIFPEEPAAEEKSEPIIESPAPVTAPPVPEPVVVPIPEPVIPEPAPVVEAPPAKLPPVVEPPAPPPALVPVKPAKAIDVPQPKPKEGLGKKLAALFSVKPKPKSVKPAKPVAPVKPALPKPLKPVKPIVVSPPKPSGGFGQKLAALFIPKPRPKVSKPIMPAAPAPEPVKVPEEPIKPAETVAPIAPIPVQKPLPMPKPVKPAPLPKPPKPKREKPPKLPVDPIAVWPPWALGLLGVGCSAFRDFGFEGMPAALWGICGWSIGMMIRLSRLYPFQSFEESTLAELSALSDGKKRLAIPVILKGQIVPAREEEPKGDVVFKQEERTLALNKIGRWDLIPRLFGLSNPRQLLKGDVTVKGWYRSSPVPYLEVQEVRAEKATRKSMSRSLRWASAVLILLIALIVYFSLE